MGAAALYMNNIQRVLLPKITSIFYAELFAIKLYIDIIKTCSQSQTKFVTFSDSLSALKSVQNSPTEHPGERRHYINDVMTTAKHVELYWIPYCVSYSIVILCKESIKQTKMQ